MQPSKITGQSATLTVIDEAAYFDDSMWEKLMPKKLTLRAHLKLTPRFPFDVGDECWVEAFGFGTVIAAEVTPTYEKVPIFTMGSPHAAAWVKGKKIKDADRCCYEVKFESGRQEKVFPFEMVIVS